MKKIKYVELLRHYYRAILGALTIYLIMNEFTTNYKSVCICSTMHDISNYQNGVDVNVKKFKISRLILRNLLWKQNVTTQSSNEFKAPT